jgi:hypothetical protein
MMVGVEPAMVGVAKRSEGSDVDHDREMVTGRTFFQVSTM